LLTGGHAATTALATIQALKKDKDHNWSISWVGPKKAVESSGIAPFELKLFPTLNVSVYSIISGKLQSKFTRHTIPALFKIPISFVQAFYYILKIRPQIVVSFGGSVALPIVIVSWLLRIPVIVHEQTVAAGLSNTVASYFARKVTLARADSLSYFNPQKTIVVGNPLIDEVLTVKRQNVLKKPTVYVTGGSRGAQRVNTVIFAALPELLKHFRVIHQTGVFDFEKAKSLKSLLSLEEQERYEIHSFINPLEIGTIFQKTTILIGRAGANTVGETIALAIPSIFIPIPWSRHDEQTKNARFAEKLGIATVLPESQLSVESLVKAVSETMKKWNVMTAHGKQSAHIDRDASKLLVSVIVQELS